MRDNKGRRNGAEPRSHAGFSVEFVYAALVIALTAGFGFSVVLAIALGTGISLGVWWLPLLQAHGHAQLWGWTGLFIMGVSLYFAPRLTGTPLKGVSLAPWICGLLTSGILIRALAQPLLAVYREGILNAVLRCGFGYGALAETAAVAGYLAVMITTMRTSRSIKDRAVIHDFRFYLAAMLCGWALSTMVNGGITIHSALSNAPVFHLDGAFIATQLYLGLVLLPVTMIFSIRAFPLYLRLPAARWPVRTVGALYLAGFGIEFIADLLARLPVFPDHPLWIWAFGAGRTMKALVLLWFIWKLDILTRKRAAWTEERAEKVEHHVRKQPRPHLPDYGEFGRFEWLLYSAYFWLAVAACLDMATGLSKMGIWDITIHEDAIRHVYLAGFVTLLLLGMAPRMIPGFLHRRAPAFPGLVTATGWLANAAVGCRILPALIPAEYLPGGATLSGPIFGISGALAWMAVLLLAWNLTATVYGRGAGERGSRGE